MTSAGAIAIDPRNPSTLFVSIGRAIYKTTDGGSTWTSAATSVFFATGILVDPINTSTAYVTSFSGLYKTTDGGVTWPQLPEAGRFITGFAISHTHQRSSLRRPHISRRVPMEGSTGRSSSGT